MRTLTNRIIIQVGDDYAELNQTLAIGGDFAENIGHDADGVPDSVENAAPNTGDMNDDGELDSEQANVASLPNEVVG